MSDFPSGDKKKLEGSRRRDRFKLLHKQKRTLNRSFYGLDLDFIIVEKYPPGIVAFFDYKTPWETITFAEVIGHNSLITLAPMFVIVGPDPENGPFTISRYLGGDWRPEPPKVQLDFQLICSDWEALDLWEDGKRKEWRQTHLLTRQQPTGIPF